MNIKTEIVLPHIYVLTFDNRYELCMSFVRMQEFYESQKFRGKYFTLEEFIDYWAKEFGHGSFNYPVLWNGFNLPDNVVRKWERCFSDNMRAKEVDILKAIYGMISEEDNAGGEYYVIGVHAEQPDETRQKVIEHEVAHALYYLSDDYKKACNEMLKNVSANVYEKTKGKLVVAGYGKNVLMDEMQAYFSTGGASCFGIKGRKNFEKNLDRFKKLSKIEKR